MDENAVPCDDDATGVRLSLWKKQRDEWRSWREKRRGGPALPLGNVKDDVLINNNAAPLVALSPLKVQKEPTLHVVVAGDVIAPSQNDAVVREIAEALLPPSNLVQRSFSVFRDNDASGGDDLAIQSSAIVSVTETEATAVATAGTIELTLLEIQQVDDAADEVEVDGVVMAVDNGERPADEGAATLDGYDLVSLVLGNEILTQELIECRTRFAAQLSAMRQERDALAVGLASQEARFSARVERLRESLHTSLEGAIARVRELECELAAAREQASASPSGAPRTRTRRRRGGS